MKCDIIIVSFNSAKYLEKCVESLFRNCERCINKLYIFDNQSTDEPNKVLDKISSKNLIDYHQNEVNLGFSRANNQGLKKCRAEFVLFLNPDTEVRQDAICHLIETLQTHPQAAIVGPRLEFPNGAFQSAWGQKMSVRMVMQELLLPGKIKSRIFRRTTDDPHLREVDWISGACLMGRRQVLQDLGGFDENIFMYSEDVDLCLRARQKGYKVLYDPAVTVIHHGGKSQKQNRAMALQANIASRIYFIKKHNSSTDYLLLLAFIALFLPARLLLHLLLSWSGDKQRDQLKAYWKSCKWFFINRPFK